MVSKQVQDNATQLQMLVTKRLWLSGPDLAHEFGVSPSTAYEWMGSGIFGQPLKIKGATRIHRQHVIRYIEKSRSKVGEELGILSDREIFSDMSDASDASEEIL